MLGLNSRSGSFSAHGALCKQSFYLPPRQKQSWRKTGKILLCKQQTDCSNSSHLRLKNKTTQANGWSSCKDAEALIFAGGRFVLKFGFPHLWSPCSSRFSCWGSVLNSTWECLGVLDAVVHPSFVLTDWKGFFLFLAFYVIYLFAVLEKKNQQENDQSIARISEQLRWIRFKALIPVLSQASDFTTAD